MKYKVLISAPYLQPFIQNYIHIFQENDIEVVVPKVKERLSETELLKIIRDIDGVICGDDEFTEKVLKSASNLKVISKWGTGIDSIDQKTANELNIVIKNIPDAFSDPVADQVLGFILAFARRIPWVNDEMKAGKWEKFPCFSLSNKTLGVIGVGNIGKSVIRRAKEFKMNLLGNDLVEMPKKFLKETGLSMVDKETLLKKSDFVSLNCDLNPTSYHIIDKKELELMKPTAYLINTARGSLVNEKALIEALQNGLIAGAGLDVFEDEPLPLESPLRSMSNVLLSPHNANSSPEHWKRVHKKSITNLLEVLNRRK